LPQPQPFESMLVPLLCDHDFHRCFSYPALQTLRACSTASLNAGAPVLEEAAKIFANEHVIERLSSAFVKLECDRLIQGFAGLQSCHFGLLALTGGPSRCGHRLAHAAQLGVANVSGVGSQNRLLEMLLLSLQDQCRQWKQNPNLPAQGDFLSPAYSCPVPAKMTKIWKDWRSWTKCFAWRDASAEQTEGPLFKRFRLRSNPHMYGQIDGTWYHQLPKGNSWSPTNLEADDPSSCERPVVFPAGLYFDSRIVVNCRHFTAMKTYSREALVEGTVRLRHLLDDNVMSAALQLARQGTETPVTKRASS